MDKSAIRFSPVEVLIGREQKSKLLSVTYHRNASDITVLSGDTLIFRHR